MSSGDTLLAKLWELPEGQRIDFKQPFAFDRENKKEKYGLVKDILSMANTEGGGYIVIGRGDNQGAAINCSDEVIASFDPTVVHKQTKKFGRPEPQFSINHAISPDGTKAIIICIREFEECLVICAKNAHDDQAKLLLREGAIYIRSKTGDAESTQVTSEQDMRCLINRSVFKSKEKLSGIFEGAIEDYIKGNRSARLPDEDAPLWKKKIDSSLAALDTLFSSKGHMLQIIAHPETYDAYILEDSKTLLDRLLDSINIYQSWPRPDFELRKIEVFSEAKEILHTSKRHFLEGELQSIVQLWLSGLFIYREELPTFYDKTTRRKPLLMGLLMMLLYQACDFFGRFYKFVSGPEKLHVSILITDTYGRYPSEKVTPIHETQLFYNAGKLSRTKLKIDFEKERREFSNNLEQVYIQLFRQLTTEMEVELSDEQIREEVDKIIGS